MGAGATTMKASGASPKKPAEDPLEESLTSVHDPALDAMLASSRKVSEGKPSGQDSGVFRPSDEEFQLLLTIMFPDLRKTTMREALGLAKEEPVDMGPWAEEGGRNERADGSRRDQEEVEAPRTLQKVSAILTNTELTVPQAAAVAAAVRGDDPDRFAVMEYLQQKKIDEEDHLAFILSLNAVVEPALTPKEIRDLQSGIRRGSASDSEPATRSRRESIASSAKSLLVAASASSSDAVSAVLRRMSSASSTSKQGAPPPRQSSLSRSLVALSNKMSAASPTKRLAQARLLQRALVAAVAKSTLRVAQGPWTRSSASRPKAIRAQAARHVHQEMQPVHMIEPSTPSALELLVDQEVAYQRTSYC